MSMYQIIIGWLLILVFFGLFLYALIKAACTGNTKVLIFIGIGVFVFQMIGLMKIL